MNIENLQLNHMDNPIGYTLNKLHFSWEVVDTEATTDYYTRIIIALDQEFKSIVYDTGHMNHYGKCYYDLNIELSDSVRYYWKVIIKNDSYDLAISRIAFFETGKDSCFWQSDWITTQEKSKAMPIIYKNFQISRKIKKATIYCCGLGLYEAKMNHSKIGNEYLMPGYYSYDLMQQYQTYDVTDLIKQGDNLVSFILGNGWYRGRFVFDGGYHNIYGDQLAVTADILIEYEDGQREHILTDSTWKACESHIFENGIYDGEVIDMNTVSKELHTKIVPLPRKLRARSNVPIVKSDSYEVKEVLCNSNDEFVLDFGEIITGWVEIKLPTDQNYTIKLQYGEILSDSKFYNDNLRTAKAEFQYSGPGNDNWIRPHFTYYGFRYVKVSGISDMTDISFRAYRLMSNIKSNGDIKTSNHQVNILIENALRSQKCNFLDIPTDCPQRDERMGWTGDISIFARTACFQMDSAAFLTNYMRILHKEQLQLDGAVPFFCTKA